MYLTLDQIQAMALGLPDAIYNRPANTYMASFSGSITMNLAGGKNGDVGKGNKRSNSGVHVANSACQIVGAHLPLVAPPVVICDWVSGPRI